MSKQFERIAAFLSDENKRHSAIMQPYILSSEQAQRAPEGCIALWRSNRFLAQIYAKENGAQHFSINRMQIDTGTGRWLEGITWEELQRVKSEIGFGDRDAVEIYPPDQDVVNVANMRHIWLLDHPLRFAWRNDERKAALFGLI